MTTPTLSTIIDTSEPRVTLSSQAVVTDGRFWDANLSSAYVDPISRTAFLMPLYKTSLWFTNNCGRLGKADLSIAGSNNWVEYQWQFPASRWIKALGVNEGVTTNTSWGVNQPFYLGWFNYGSGGEEYIAMECGWSDGMVPYNASTASTPDIRLNFWSNGKVEVFKNGQFVGEGNIFERKTSTQNAYAKETTATKADSKQLAGGLVEVMLLPCRRRELLILSNVGGGFSFVFEDIDVNNPAPVVTGAGKFFVYQPVSQPTFQIAPLQFLTSGSAISLLTSFRNAPSAGSPVTASYWDASGYGTAGVSCSLVQENGSSTFVANGSRRVCRLRLDLTGDGTTTPCVYGAAGVYPRQTANTDGAHATTLDPWITHSSLSVPESPTDALYTMQLNSPQAIEAAGAANIRAVANRPLVAKIGTVALLTGRTKAPQWTEGVNDTARHLVIEARDRCMANELHRIKSPVPIDGANISDAIRYFAQMPGYSSGDMDVESIDYALPTSGQTSEGEWALLPEVGDTSLQWIQRLWETFARNYSWGWVPRASGPKFRFNSLQTLNSASLAATLYGTIAEALAASVSPNVLPAHAYKSYRETGIFPEANDIWVTGRNPKTGRPLQTHYADYAAQDPTLAPSARPANWTGEIWYYGWVDPAITTLEDGLYCCAQLAQRLTARRVLGEWTSDFLLWGNGQPVWRGDLVRLVGLGTYRIISLQGDFKSEYASPNLSLWPDHIWRPFTYVGERISTETPYGTI